MKRNAHTSILAATLLIFSLLKAGEAEDFLDISFKRAQNLASNKGKVVMVKFEADWCQLCQRMDRETLSDERVQAALREIIAIRVDMDSAQGREMGRRRGVVGLPTLLFFAPEGNLLDSHAGFLNVTQFLSMLQKIEAKRAKASES